MMKSRLIAWAAGCFLFLLCALLLLVPVIVDSEAVKAKASAYVAEKTKGLARFEKIEIFWFPRPGVVFRDAAISFDKQIEGKIQQLTLYPSLRHMLTWRLAFASVTADGASWIVRLAERYEEPFNLDELEEKVRAVVNNLGLAFPGMNLQVRGGMADIRLAGGPSLKITDIDATLGVTLDSLDFAVSAAANFTDQIRLSGEIATNSLTSEARLSVANLDLRKILDLYFPGSIGWVDDGAVTLSLNLRAAGLKSFSAEIAGSQPSLTLARGARKALIKANDFKGTVTGDEKVVRLDIGRMNLIAPQLSGAGELMFDRASSSLSLKLSGRNLDAQEIREITLGLAGDVKLAQDIFRYIRGGKMPAVKFESRGRSFAEMLKVENIVVAGNLHGGRVFIPGPDLHLENVAASVLISGGILVGKDCSAAIGKAKGRDGVLRVGLAPANAPFHLDIMVETQARELHSLLVRHVKDDEIRKEVSRFRDVDGSVSGRLVLGETLDAISAKVLAVPAALTASYEPVPYPVSLKGGRLNYDNGKIEAESLAGAIGRSSFSGLTGTVRADQSGPFNIKSASLQLDLEQIETLLRKVETIQAKLGPESAAQGKINVTAISLSGPLNDPRRWDFTGTGNFEKILIKHAQLPAALAITRGTFDASHEKLTYADAKVELLDASLTASGVVENWRKAPLRLEATVSGIAGARMMDWGRRQTEVPAAYMLRSPLEFSESRVAWRDDTDFSFNGKLTVADGPRISLDMTRNLHRLTVKELLIDDGGKSSRATFESDRDKWGFSFRGSLDKKALDRVFLTLPLQIGLLQGDFEVSAFREHPLRFSARGTVVAKNLVSPVGKEDTIIEQIVVEGDKTGLNIRAADLRWRESQVSAAGKLAITKEALRIDMDVAADRLVWEEFSEFTVGGDGGSEKEKTRVSLPPLEGLIRLKTGSFAVGTFYWNPLQVSAELTPSGINGEVQDGVVCGIRTAGRFSAQKNGEINLDMRLSVRDGELESTSRCLSGEKSHISGTYSLNARLAGGGKREQLARTLSGEFDFVARDGKFVRSRGVDATFDYLNRTGDFNVAFPDLDNEAMPYRLISGKGRVAGQSIFAEELIIEATPYAITAQAKADFERKSIEAKGLVTVLLPADKIIKNIPLVGSILSGSIIGIPVVVTGTFEQPEVSYLSPAALGAEIVNIPLRILRLPLGALQIFTPGQPGLEKR